MSEQLSLGLREHSGPWTLQRGLDGKPLKLSVRGSLVAGQVDSLGRMPVRLLASTEAINSFGFRVLNSAIAGALEAYNQNPILLAYHDLKRPIGRGVAIMTANGMEYPPLSATNPNGAYISAAEPAVQVLVADGTLRGSSISFDVVGDQEGADGIPEVTELRMVETSVVPAGSNPEAFVEPVGLSIAEELVLVVASPPSMLSPTIAGCTAAAVAAVSLMQGELSGLARQRRSIETALSSLPINGLSRGV